MRIVVAVKCYNEAANIERFMRAYDFANLIVCSDGGSTDGSIEMLKKYPKVHLVHFGVYEESGGYRWNPGNPHSNFVIAASKEFDPDWIILDDMDCVPNRALREGAREILERTPFFQANAFRLYMWGEGHFFPKMNNYFDPAYVSLWAWRPSRLDIHADDTARHGTMLNLSPEFERIQPPLCLLHRCWSPDTVQEKMNKYNAVGIPMRHPLEFAGSVEPLPAWAVE